MAGAGGTLLVPYSQITDQVSNANRQDNGKPTDQAYWQAIAGVDTRHIIHVDGISYGTEYGEIAVSFADPTHAVITNNSGTDWTKGRHGGFSLTGTRSFHLRQPIRQHTTVDPVVDRRNGPGYAGSGGRGESAYDYFDGTERPRSGRRKGAL